MKNKKKIFLGTFIPSRTVQKIPTGHVVPSRNMQLHFCTEKGEKIRPATGPVHPLAQHAHCTVNSAPPAASPAHYAAYTAVMYPILLIIQPVLLICTFCRLSARPHLILLLFYPFLLNMQPTLLLLQHVLPVLQPFLLILQPPILLTLQPILFVLQLILFLLQPSMPTVQSILLLLQPVQLNMQRICTACHVSYPAHYSACPGHLHFLQAICTSCT